MAFCIFHLTESGRTTLGRVGTSISVLLVMLGIAIIGMAMFVRSRVQSKLQLLENYSGNSFVYYLVTVGILMIVIHIVAMKVFADLGFYESRYKWENTTRLFGLIIVVVSFVVLATIVVVFTHQFTMHKYFKNGLKSAMERYSKTPEVKRQIDGMQLELQCCGSNDTSDWFAVAWVDNAFLDMNSPEVKKGLKDGAYRGENAPFSCCSTKSPRPCIHRNVMDARTAYVWPKDSTLHKGGCARALAEEFGKTALNATGYIVLAAYILMLLLLVILKLLSTAISNTYPWGDPEGAAPTWLCEACPFGICDTETPSPPDEEPITIPGASGPVKKKKKPSLTPITEHEAEDDVSVSDAPLLQASRTSDLGTRRISLRPDKKSFVAAPETRKPTRVSVLSGQVTKIAQQKKKPQHARNANAADDTSDEDDAPLDLSPGGAGDSDFDGPLKNRKFDKDKRASAHDGGGDDSVQKDRKKPDRGGHKDNDRKKGDHDAGKNKSGKDRKDAGGKPRKKKGQSKKPKGRSKKRKKKR